MERKDRVILHSDCNSFYASVEALHHPELKGLPLAVAGDPENRHGIILAKNQLAKQYGVKTAEAIWEAKQKCPGLVVIQPDYPLYSKFSKMARAIYYSYTDKVEPFGLDEAWLDVTGSVHLFGNGEEIAQEIRKRIREELGITVSIGVSWNKIFAKFGSDYKKPDAVTCITRENYKKIVWEKPVGDLLYVGRATERKLRKRGIDTVGRLAEVPVTELRLWFGKIGEVLWTFANGHDISEVKLFDPQNNDNDRVIKSIGNSITTPRDLVCENEVKLVLYMLTESVAMRTREAGFKCKTFAISVRDKNLQSFTRQLKLDKPTDITREMAEAALKLFKANYNFSDQSAIRSLGVHACDLIGAATPVQLDLFGSEEQRIRQERLDSTIDKLRSRFGNNIVRRAITLGDTMSELDPKRDNVIHPVGYF